MSLAGGTSPSVSCRGSRWRHRVLADMDRQLADSLRSPTADNPCDLDQVSIDDKRRERSERSVVNPSQNTRVRLQRAEFCRGIYLPAVRDQYGDQFRRLFSRRQFGVPDRDAGTAAHYNGRYPLRRGDDGDAFACGCREAARVAGSHPGGGKRYVEIVIISPDNYRIIRGEYIFDPATEVTVWGKAYAAVSECLSRHATLVVLVGLPRSGKSTWARANDTDELCIFDATSTSVLRRRELCSKVRGGGKTIAVFFDTPFDVCLERNKLRPRGPLPDQLMAGMRDKLTRPTMAEGFWQVITVHHLSGT